MGQSWILIAQGAACGLVFGLLWLLGRYIFQPRKSEGIADVVKARRFELVDADDSIRAVLSVMSDERSSLCLLDENQATRLSLQVLPDGSPGLYLYDDEAVVRASLAMSTDGVPGLLVTDEATRPRVFLSVMTNGAPRLGMYDERGNEMACLELMPDGIPSFSMSSMQEGETPLRIRGPYLARPVGAQPSR